MKIVHFSDLHLKKFYKGKLPLEISNKIIEDVWTNLNEVCKYINQISADIVLIAGDVYDREFFNLSDMNRFLNIIKTINAKVFISCGNHDYFDSNSLWNRVEYPENLHVFSNELSYIDLEDIGARVFGISYDSFKFNKKLVKPDFSDNLKNILVMHCDLEDERYLSPGLEYFRHFDYVALGHIHMRMRIMENAYYSGSIEPHHFKDSGERGIIIFDTDTRSVNYKDFSIKNFRTIEYEVKEDMTFDNIYSDVQSLLNDRDLYRIKLTGKHENYKQIGNFLKNNLSAFYVEIINNVKNNLDIYDVFGNDRLIMNFLDSFTEEEKDSKDLAIEYLLEQYNEI